MLVFKNYVKKSKFHTTQEINGGVISGMGPVAPVLPPRHVELQVSAKKHKMWLLNNINLCVPISVSCGRLGLACLMRQSRHVGPK